MSRVVIDRPAVRPARLVALAVLAAWVAVLPGRPARATAPAAGGVHLLASMEDAPVTAVGTIYDRKRLDARAFSARLRLENVLVAPLPLAVLAAEDEPYEIVWEERSPARPPRFVDGDRILVVLEALPGDSIWLERIPDVEARRRALHVAQRGDAFLRRPSLRTIGILEHLLALAPGDRRDAPGVVHLADLASSAAAPLALDAVTALAGIERLDEKLDRSTRDWLVDALVRRDAPEPLRRAMLELITARRLRSLEPVLESRIEDAVRSAPKGAPAPADPVLYAALAGLRGDLDPVALRQLGAHADAGHRMAAVLAASSPADLAMLTRLARQDADAAVRGAAVARMVDLQGEGALPVAIDALRDDDADVRHRAAEGLARIGAPAVPDLRRVVDGDAQPAMVAAVSALREIAPEGVRALYEIAETHPDASTRAAARLALGLDLTPGH